MKKALAMALCGVTSLSLLTGCGLGGNTAALEKEIEELEEKIDELKDENKQLKKEIKELTEGESAAEGNGGAATEAPAEEVWEEVGIEDVSGDVSEGEAIEDEEDYGVEEVVYPSNVKIDPATGEPYDLGGMEIIIRDWWSDPEYIQINSDYDEAVQEYHDWLQETYNFKITQMAISDWGTTPADFVDYVTCGGDDCNYIFTVREDPAIASAMQAGLMYDLASLGVFDFSQNKFQSNKVCEQYSLGSSVYAMSAGAAEPRTGVYFNKDILRAAGIDPESIYDMQANGTWTWDAFMGMMDTVQYYTGAYGLTCNESLLVSAAVYSNGGEFVGKDNNGNYYSRLWESPTYDALWWASDVINTFDNHDPEGVAWDYYKEEFLSGQVAFLVDDAYCGYDNGYLSDAWFEFGFVMFPTGYDANYGAYKNCWTSNPLVIPACYDYERARKIAFAYNLWTEDPAGYEDYVDLSRYYAGYFDYRAVTETIPMMMDSNYGMVTYHSIVPGIEIGPDLLWSFVPYMYVDDVIWYADNKWWEYLY